MIVVIVVVGIFFLLMGGYALAAPAAARASKASGDRCSSTCRSGLLTGLTRLSGLSMTTEGLSGANRARTPSGRRAGIGLWST